MTLLKLATVGYAPYASNDVAHLFGSASGGKRKVEEVHVLGSEKEKSQWNKTS